MPEQKLHVLTPVQASGRRLLRRHDPHRKGPLFFSFGAVNLVCGACLFLLMEGMPRGGAALGGVVLECPNCSALNSGAPPAGPAVSTTLPGARCSTTELAHRPTTASITSASGSISPGSP